MTCLAGRERKMRRCRHKLFKTIRAVFLVLGILQLAACGARKKETDRTIPGAENDPIAVSSAVTQARQAPLFVEATGSFIAEESSNVAPLTSGRVTETPVDVGARIEKGQIIARLDDSDAALRLQQAKASVEQADAALRQAQAKIGLTASFKAEDVPDVQSARASYESSLADAKMAEADARRYDSLVQTGDISRSSYEKQTTLAETAKAKANTSLKQYETALNNARQNYQAVASAQAMLASARAQLAQAQKAVDDTLIRAPISGHVTERQISVGEYVAPSSRIVTIARANPIKLQLQIPAIDVGKIAVGMRVLARIESFGSHDFEGKITALNPSLDPNSRSMTAEAKFENPKLDLRPGMFSTARVILPGTEQAVVAPRNAVFVDPTINSAEVFVLQQNKAQVRVVQIGEENGGMVRIFSGVSVGEAVATSKLQQLYDGAAVKLQ
jgi:multidrug efflux pump subunit AcrA (membrane-fusion protein)